MQSREGGHDLVGLDWLAIEVKRHETLHVPAWWRQTLDQAERAGAIPFLAYRQNRTPWRFRVRLWAAHYGPSASGVSQLDVDLAQDAACAWFRSELYYRLQP